MLTYRGKAGGAAKILREELENAKSLCRSVITVKADKDTVRAFVSRKLSFAMQEDGKIILEKETTPDLQEASDEAGSGRE